ncbi:hypothetical protein CW304_28840 [Bacillus sp. UFRGS-B20]|nr:hypothetical protein CW304_28840 [Bacillus sp. UFRGS-B20]
MNPKNWMKSITTISWKYPKTSNESWERIRKAPEEKAQHAEESASQRVILNDFKPSGEFVQAAIGITF